MRSRLGFLIVAVTLAACAHKKPPPAPPPPPPAPKGDLLRLKATAGDEPKAKVTLLIENEAAAAQGAKGGTRKVSLNFGFSEEEKVDAVSPDGAAQISARLIDVSGEATTGAEQKDVDDFALALDELKIQFRRTPRGEVAGITVSGVRRPLDDKQARAILNALYDAGRGALLPEDFVDVGATWKVDTTAPTASGTPADASYQYKYTAKNDGIAVIDGEGGLESKSGGGGTAKRVTVKSTTEHKIEVATGRLAGKSVDVTTQVEDTVPGQQTLQVALKLRVKVGWTSVAPAAAK